MRDRDLAEGETSSFGKAENTQLFARSGALVAETYVPPAAFDVLNYRGRAYVKKAGRYVEATVYEVRG